MSLAIALADSSGANSWRRLRIVSTCSLVVVMLLRVRRCHPRGADVSAASSPTTVSHPECSLRSPGLRSLDTAKGRPHVLPHGVPSVRGQQPFRPPEELVLPTADGDHRVGEPNNAAFASSSRRPSEVNRSNHKGTTSPSCRPNSSMSMWCASSQATCSGPASAMASTTSTSCCSNSLAEIRVMRAYGPSARRLPPCPGTKC